MQIYKTHTHTHTHTTYMLFAPHASFCAQCLLRGYACVSCICSDSSPASDSSDEEEEDVKLAEMKKRSQTTHYT